MASIRKEIKKFKSRHNEREGMKYIVKSGNKNTEAYKSSDKLHKYYIRSIRKRRFK